MIRALLFSVALVSGGFAAWLVASTQSAETRTTDAGASVAVPMDEVLVAARDVEQGVELLPEHLRWQNWPADAVDPAFIVRSLRPEAVEKLAGLVTRGSVTAGEPIVDKKLAPARSGFLSAVLTPGMRAVAISISAEKTAGGFVLPNDRVDVLLTVPCRPEDGCSAGMTVRTILRNVRVLAIDQSGKDSGGAENALVGKTATLELDPLQVETLIGAEASGALSLVLRSAADHAAPADEASERSRTVRVRREGVSEYVTVR